LCHLRSTFERKQGLRLEALETTIHVPIVYEIASNHNGLNQREFYHDANGVNHYNGYDGAEPGAALLSDGVNVYTPGISQRNAATSQSKFFVTDAQGSLRGTHDAATTMLDDLRFDAFGQQDFHGGASPSALPLAWHQSSNYQTDNDSGLMLLGNRYYDSVVGRFISPDPAGDGDNWYAYCDNDPLGEVDPEGLMATGMSAPTGASFGNPMGQMNEAANAANNLYYQAYDVRLEKWSNTSGSSMHDGVITPTDTGWHMDWSVPLGNSYDGYFQLAGAEQQGPKGTTYRMDMGEKPKPDMHIYHSQGETNIDHLGRASTKIHRGQPTKPLPKNLRASYRPIIKSFLQKAGLGAAAIEAAIDGMSVDLGIVFFNTHDAMYKDKNGNLPYGYHS